jgi:hypothetical protein
MSALPDDATPHAIAGVQSIHRTGKGGGKPSSASSTKVAWTLRDKGKIVEVFDFVINPQGITRVESSRAQVFSTKGGHYADDFGPGPAMITLRQIVASGKRESHGGGHYEAFTLREDVQRFIKRIYRPATIARNHGRHDVWFHDNHLEQGHDERILFPQNALTLQRAVDLQGVWLLELQMISLEKNPYGDVSVDRSPVPPHLRTHKYVVKRGDTLNKIVARVAGRGADAKKRKQVLARIIVLNPWLKHRRHLQRGDSGYVGTKTITAKPYQVVPGEVMVLPGGAASGGGVRGSGPGVPPVLSGSGPGIGF